MKNFICFFFFFSIILHAQLETAHWYFGNNAGLDFSNDSPISDTNGKLNTHEGCTSISDQFGNLLFYTDGVTVYNRKHLIMSNGNNLSGHISSTQSAIIIPNPYKKKIYYIFTSDNFTNNNGIHYSIVDMNLDLGNGELLSNYKNIPLPLNGLQKASEKLVAVKHSNGKDIWVITHLFNSYFSFLINHTGIVNNPVVSISGPKISSLTEEGIGYLKVSPNGKKIAAAHRTNSLVISDFDSSTGEISNSITLDTEKQFYGIEFSPNSNILYCSITNTNELYQFNLNSQPIPESKLLLVQNNNVKNFGALQLGLDKKIYLSKFSDHLSVISNPNEIGTYANFVENGIYLNGKKSAFGLPNFITSLFNTNILINESPYLSAACNNELLTFSLDSNLNLHYIIWDFGDGSPKIEDITPSHTYTTPGNYTIKTTIHYKDQYNNDQTTNLTKFISIGSPPIQNLGNDRTACEDNSFLNAGNEGSTFLWNTGETTQTIKVKKSGTYIVTITNSYGCTIQDSINITLVSTPVVNLGEDKIICKDSLITLDAGNKGCSYQWNTGETTQKINISKAGTYAVTITNTNGCKGTGKIMLTTSELSINNIKIINNQNTIQIIPTGSPPFEHSLDLINWQSSPIFTNLENMEYKAYIKNIYGCISDHYKFKIFSVPNVITPNGDGHNDVWNIHGLETYLGSRIRIFDRYGKLLIDKIFKGNPIWDGTYLGKPVHASSYQYIIDLINNSGKLSGWLVIRNYSNEN